MEPQVLIELSFISTFVFGVISIFASLKYRMRRAGRREAGWAKLYWVEKNTFEKCIDAFLVVSITSFFVLISIHGYPWTEMALL